MWVSRKGKPIAGMQVSGSLRLRGGNKEWQAQTDTTTLFETMEMFSSWAG